MTYDTYKNDSPEPYENNCKYCGEECDEDFCDSDCRKAYENDN